MLFDWETLSTVQLNFVESLWRISFLKRKADSLFFLLFHFSGTYRYRADHRNAIRIWEEETLPVYERELGEHPWTASILYFIATSYKIIAKRESGDYAEKGKTKIMAALEIQEKLLGIHLDTARSHVCLGAILKIQGELKLALEELDKGLKIREEVLGPHHEKTIETREFKARVQRLYEGSN